MRFGNFTALLCIFILQYVPCIITQAIVPGYLDFDNLPDTNFSCEGKVIGGYYADIETGCQMFHVCTIGQKGEITDIKFLCLNGTVFDQETRVCERVDEVDCSKTEGFYDLNLELYGNNAALSFPEEEEEVDDIHDDESQENAETSDSSSHNQSPKQKTSTSKPLTTSSPSAVQLTPHPASTTTSRPVHPYVPTTTAPSYKSHFHSTTSPSISAFLAINNAFSNSNQGKLSSQYDDEEEEEDEESITEQILQHHFPVTTIRTQVHHGSVSQPNVKIQGTGESGFLRNQQNPPKHLYPTPKSELVPPTSTHPSHLYSHSYHHDDIKDQSAHSKHQHNTQLILHQQRNAENKNHHGFKPVTSTENRSHFLFSSSTQQPPVYFTTKNSVFSTTLRSSTREPFPIHAIGPQPPQLSSNNPSFLPQTNAHQVPSASGTYVTQNAQASRQPPSFQFGNNNDRQGHQLLTTPSIAVIATTSSTSSSSSAKAVPTRKTSISPEISHTSFIGNTDRRTSSPKNSSVSVQVLPETPSPTSYEEYQEADVATDPFFQDVPRLTKSVSSSTSVIQRKKRSAKRNRRQLGLPTEIFDTGSNRARGGTSRDFHQESQRQRTLRYRARLESTSTLPVLETGTPTRKAPAVTELPEPETFRVSPESAHILHTEVSSPANVQDHSNHNSRRIVRVRGRKPLHRSNNEHGDVTREGVTTSHTDESVSHVTDRSPGARQDFGNRRGQARVTNSQGQRQVQNATPASTPRRRVVHRLRGSGSNKASKTPSGDDSLREAKAENVTEDVVVEPPPPTTPLPETNFTCDDKIPGGYYADLEADCQLFHICSQGRHGRIKDNKFLCGPGTRFNQLSRTCQARELVDCNRSASLYYLNSHFKVEPPESLKPELDFEPKKVHRVKRKAAKGPSEPEYTIDNIPETSFRCSDKGKEGLYADVETQCKVFHLCRIISGRLTLESSFVCPPGTVFNQPEGSCDTTKEVDCELYSAPEHSFRKTPGSGNKNKTRNKRNSSKKSAHLRHDRVKRESAIGKDKVDYYDYVDDNYEAYIAHTANPVDATPPTKDNHTLENSTDVYDYVYDEDYDYEAENYTNQDSTRVPQIKGRGLTSTEMLEIATDEINSAPEEFQTTTVPLDDTEEYQIGNSNLVNNNTDMEKTYMNETKARMPVQNETMSDHQEASSGNEYEDNHESKVSTTENNLKTNTPNYQDNIPIATGSAEENDEEYYEYDYEEYDDELPVKSTNNNQTFTETNSKHDSDTTEASTLEDMSMTTQDPMYISEEDKISTLDDLTTVPKSVEDIYNAKSPDNPKSNDSESETRPHVSQDRTSVSDSEVLELEKMDHRYLTSSVAPEVLPTTPPVREYSSSELPLSSDESTEDYEDYIDATTHEMTPYDITTTAEALNEITPTFTQEGRVTRNEDSEHTQEVAVPTTTIASATSNIPTTTAIPTTSTIPSLFRPIKPHKVFRNRFSVPAPPPVSIRPMGQPTASRRNIQRGTTTRNRNTVTGKDGTKKTNKHQDDSLSDKKETLILELSTEVPTTTPIEIKQFGTEYPSLETKTSKKNANTIVKTGYTKEEPHEDISITSTYTTHSPTTDTVEQVTTSSTLQSKDTSLVSQTNMLDLTSGITTKLPHHAHLGHHNLSSGSSQSSVLKDTSFVCTGKEMHQYHPDPEDCRMFHYCSPGFHSRQFLDFRFKCENGTVFDAKSQKCVSEQLLPCSVSAGHKVR